MKLSLTINNKTYSVETDEVYDGSDVYELAGQFKGLLVNAGYHPCNVDSIFNLDNQWFSEQEIRDNLQGHTKEEVQEWQNHLYDQPKDIQEECYQAKLDKEGEFVF